MTPAALWLAEVDALAVIAMDGANFDGAARYRLTLYDALSPERVRAMVTACKALAEIVRLADIGDSINAAMKGDLLPDNLFDLRDDYEKGRHVALESARRALAALDASHATGGLTCRRKTMI